MSVCTAASRTNLAISALCPWSSAILHENSACADRPFVYRGVGLVNQSFELRPLRRRKARIVVEDALGLSDQPDRLKKLSFD